MNSDLTPIFVSLAIAVIGSLGGFAALLRVQNENTNSLASGAKSVSDGAKTVVEMMNERMDEGEERLDHLEEYISKFDMWADRLISMLDTVIGLLPEALRAQYLIESNNIKHTRPRRRTADKQDREAEK